MTFMVTFNVYGEPVAKGRPRFTRQGRTYTPKKTHDYESEVAMMAKAAMGSQEPLETPIAVYIYATYTIPASYSKKRREACLNGFEKHTKRPDADNVGKTIMDAMNGVVYKDDCQITNLHIKKVYGTTAMVEVLVKEDL